MSAPKFINCADCIFLESSEVEAKGGSWTRHRCRRHPPQWHGADTMEGSIECDYPFVDPDSYGCGDGATESEAQS